jgi:uncharacterized protein (TIGR03643 family)
MAEKNITLEGNELPNLTGLLAKKEEQEILNNQANKVSFNAEDSDRIIQMAWEDRTPFEAIQIQFGLKEKDVIAFMRKNSLPSSFIMWRKRMKSRKTKHAAKRIDGTNRFKCSRQKSTGNKISKR